MKLVWAILVLGVACGPTVDVDLTYTEADTPPKTTKTGSTPVALAKEDERIEVPVRMVLDNGSPFSLIDVTAAVSFSVTLSGCASGFSQTSTTTLAPYKFDRGCYAKLNSFVYDSTDNYTYNQVAAGATAFTDSLAGYAIGEKAIFATASDVGASLFKSKMRVYVSDQVSNPITTGDEVIFKFSHITQGSTQTTLKSTVSETGTAVTVTSVNPPSFTIDSVTLVNVTAGGAGEWRVTFDCTANVAGAGDNRTCTGVDIFDHIRVALVQDTFASSPTVSQLETAFGIAAGSGFGIASGDIHGIGGTTAHGGFRTANTGDGSVLVGPTQMHNNPNMLIILRSVDPVDSNSFSWQYFNFDIDVNG